MSLPSLHQLPIGVATRQFQKDEGQRRLPWHQYGRKVVLRSHEEIATDECEICQMSMGPFTDWSVLCVNGHAFHNTCIDGLIRVPLGGTCPTGKCALTTYWAAERAALVAAGDVDMDEAYVEEQGQDEDEDEDEDANDVICSACDVEFSEDDPYVCYECGDALCDDCVVQCANCDDVYCSSCADTELRDGWCETCRSSN